MTAAVLALLASLPFLQVAGFAFLNYDDPLHVGARPEVLSGLDLDGFLWSLTATPSNLWHPLTWISYMAEVSVFGGGAESPGIHHLGNLVLHLGATVFFFLLLRNLEISATIAGLAALLFSVHPLQAEPVAWISSRKDVLYGFFAMAALFCHSRRLQGRSDAWRWAALLTMVAAVCSKPTAVILPGLFLLLDYFAQSPDRRGAATGGNEFLRRVLDKWPYLVVSVLGALGAVAIQYSGSHGSFVSEEGLAERLALLPAGVGFYLQRVFWPVGLTFDYAAPAGARRLVLTCVGCLTLVAPIIWAGRLWGGNRSFRIILLGWLWFLVCLSPVLGFFYVGSGFTADRYAYLALAGPTLALALLVGSPAKSGGRNAGRAGGGMVVFGLLAVVAGVLCHRQARVWKDDLAFFSHGVAVEPESGVAQTNLASLHRLRGEDDLALLHYRKALKLHASHYIVHYNMAAIHRKRGMLAEAIESCRLSLRSHPEYARSYHLLGELLEERELGGAEALDHFERALRIEPRNARFAISLALANARRQRYEEADRVLRDVLGKGVVSPAQGERIRGLLQKLDPYLKK